MHDELVLYTNPWSRGAIAHWMLEEVGAPYRLEVLDYEGQMKTPEYLALNPMGKVPTLVDGDTVVTETAAICAYLADTHPESGLAPAPAHRGAYYRWLFFGAGPFDAAMSISQCGFRPDARQQMMLGYGSLERVVDTLSWALRRHPHLAGDAFSAADVYVGSLLGWNLKFGSIEARPEFVEYWERIRQRPAHLRTQAPPGDDAD